MHVGMRVKIVTGIHSVNTGIVTQLTPKQCDVKYYDRKHSIERTVNLPPRALVLAEEPYNVHENDDESATDCIEDNGTLVTEENSVGKNSISLNTLMLVSDVDNLDDLVGVSATMKHHLRHLAKEFYRLNIDAESTLPTALMHISMKEINK